MSLTMLVWVCLAAAAVLATWLIVRFPDRRPTSVGNAILFFLAGQIAPNLGLFLLPFALRVGHGAPLAFAAVVLPAFFVLWLTSGWLLLAISDAVGGPRGRAVRHPRHDPSG
jgi:hypothetical protein